MSQNTMAGDAEAAGAIAGMIDLYGRRLPVRVGFPQEEVFL